MLLDRSVFKLKTISRQIYELGIVPVVKLDRAEDAVPLAKALMNGGLPVAEITFRTDAAEESIKKIAAELPEMLIGAGTILTTEQADRAMTAGAKFIVSPGLNEKVVSHCVEKGYPIYPGCSTPGDVERALALGINEIKFFPAEQSGGLEMIKALSAPYVNATFMPTGGINEANLNSYLAFDKIIACGGSWMVKDDLIKAGRFDEIERLTAAAVQKMLSFSIVHIGCNCGDEATAQADAKELGSLLGLPLNESAGNIFVGSIFEIIKSNYLGKNGHIAIGTNSVDRAAAYFAARGFALHSEAVSYDDKGRMKVAYLEKEFAGFAVHLVNAVK